MIKKKKILRFVVILSIIMAATMINSSMLRAATHYVTIYDPNSTTNITELYKTDYEYYILKTISEPRDSIKFSFRVLNDDGYYYEYHALIDGYPDAKLNGLGWGFHEVQYDAQEFLQRYGRGTHTFRIDCYHAVPFSGFPHGLVEDDSPDSDRIVWINHQGFILELADQVSVSFKVNPPLCHFVGFSYDDNLSTFLKDVLILRDMLHDPSAHYLEGFFDVESYWTPNLVSTTIENLDEHEYPQDIDVILFFTHGLEGNGYSVDYKDEVLKPEDLFNILSCLDSQNLIVILQACYSGTYLPTLSKLTNPHHIMASSEAWEPSKADDYAKYDPNWSLEEKIQHVSGIFLNYFCYYLFYNSATTEDAFDYADSQTQIRTYDTQHPTEHRTISGIRLYINIGG